MFCYFLAFVDVIKLFHGFFYVFDYIFECKIGMRHLNSNLFTEKEESLKIKQGAFRCCGIKFVHRQAKNVFFCFFVFFFVFNIYSHCV